MIGWAVERILLGNMDINLNILKNRNIRNIIGSMEHVNLEEITRTLEQLSIGKLNAENDAVVSSAKRHLKRSKWAHTRSRSKFCFRRRPFAWVVCFAATTGQG